LLVETLLCREFGWDIEFLTGGIGIMALAELVEHTKLISAVFGEKLWLNLGPLSGKFLEKLKPYLGGVCGSMETLHPEIHKEVCPDKPIESYTKMFESLELNYPNIRKSIAIIVGLGDKVEDMHYLFDYIRKNKLDRITVYALKPVKDTLYKYGPSVDEYVNWIARLRIEFPKLEIIAGTNLRRAEEVGFLVRAGANAVTKFPITKQFGTEKAKLMKRLIEKEGRELIGNITKYEEKDWDKIINKLDVDDALKQGMKKVLPSYLHKMSHPRDYDDGCCLS